MEILSYSKSLHVVTYIPCVLTNTFQLEDFNFHLNGVDGIVQMSEISDKIMIVKQNWFLYGNTEGFQTGIGG